MNPIIMLLAGGCYAAVFWMVAVRRPGIALLLIFALAPFQNDVSGGGPVKFSLAEINILLSLPIVLVRARHLRFGATLIPALLYMGACGFSALGQWHDSAPTSLVQIALYTVFAVTIFASLPREEKDLRLAMDGAVMVNTIFALLILGLRTSSIFGMNKNGIGSSLAAGFVIALARWAGAEKKARTCYFYSMLLIGAGCFLTLSRGAWMAAVSGGLIVLVLRRRFRLIAQCAVVLIPALIVGWFLLPQESRSYATGFSAENNFNIRLRYESIHFAWQTFLANPLQGGGLGLRKEYDATNVILMTLAETGVPGLTTFLFLNASVAFVVFNAYRRVQKGTFAASVLAIALALVVGKFMHGLVDHYWSRGSLTMVWASVGMAVWVAHDQRARRRRDAQAAALARQGWEEGFAAELSPLSEPAPVHETR